MFVEQRSVRGCLLTIEKGVEDESAVLFDEVVDVTENATGDVG